MFNSVFDVFGTKFMGAFRFSGAASSIPLAKIRALFRGVAKNSRAFSRRSLPTVTTDKR